MIEPDEGVLVGWVDTMCLRPDQGGTYTIQLMETADGKQITGEVTVPQRGIQTLSRDFVAVAGRYILRPKKPRRLADNPIWRQHQLIEHRQRARPEAHFWDTPTLYIGMDKQEVLERAQFAQQLPGDGWDIKSDFARQTSVLGSGFELSIRAYHTPPLEGDDPYVSIQISRDQEDIIQTMTAGKTWADRLNRAAIDMIEELQLYAAQKDLPADVALGGMEMLAHRLNDIIDHETETTDGT